VLLSNLGEIAQRQGDLDRAMTLYAEALPLFQELGDRRNIAATLGTIGEVELARGNVTGGRVLLADSLTMFNEVGDKEEIARRLEVLAGFAVDQEQAEVAASLLGGAAALRDQIGAPLATVYRADYERWVATTRKALGELAFAATWEAGKALPIDQAIAEAVALARGEPASAQASDSPAVIAPAPSSTITRADGKS
jgi:tetratricopeptide (TPR) repeat protein